MANSTADPSCKTGVSEARWAIACIVVVALCIRLFLLFCVHRTAEDFYITLRYAENIAHGGGFVYNAGERVLGTTTPLYTLLLALVEWMGLNTILLGQMVNAAADAASCYALWRFARSAAGRQGGAAGLIGAAVLAAWPPSIYWSISGMETGLVTLAGMAALASTAERRPIALAAWAAVLVLLRIDGLLLAAICFGWLALNARRTESDPSEEPTGEGGGVSGDKRDLLAAFGLFAGLLLPWLAFATVYFGSAVPTSLIAKLHVYGWQNPGLLPNLRPFTRDMTRNPFYWVLLAGALPGVACAWRHRACRPSIAWMLAYFVGMAFSRSFLFGWYYVPPIPVYILSAAMGWCWMVGLLSRPSGLSAAPAARIAVAGILATGILLVPRQRAMILADQRQDEALLKSTGVMLRDVVKPGETLMLEPIGWIGYYSGAKVLDAVGLVSPEVITYFRPGAVSPYVDMMADLKPEWALLRTGEYDAAMTAPVPHERQLLAGYTLNREIPDPINPGGRPAFYLMKRR